MDELGVPAERQGSPGWLHAISTSAREREDLARRLATLRVVLIGHAELTQAVGAALVGSGIAPERVPYPEAGEDLAQWMAGADLVVAADDGALPVLHPWANTTGLMLDVPTLHAEFQGTQATVGPLVLPGGGPCFLCWRMRALACVDDFEAAMALEEERDARRNPEVAARSVPPSLLSLVTGATLAELFALTLAVPRLTAGVLTIDALGGEELHAVLPRPDCPACSKKAVGR